MSLMKHYGWALLMVLFTFGCQEPATESNTENSEPTEMADPASSELAKLQSKDGSPRGYVLDINNSSIKWQGSKKLGTGKHNGTLAFQAGKLVVQDGTITEGELRVDMKSLHTTDFERGTDMYNKLVGHLKSDDFFDVEKYPTATFKITRFEPFKMPSTDANYNVQGELTIKEVTEPIFFPALVQVDGNKIRATVSLQIDRSKWNVQYGSESFFDLAKDEIISDNIHLEISIVTI